MNTLYVWTEDDLRLQGVHYESENKDICVLIVHGMSGNIIENYFADVLGKTLAKNNIGCIYGHNRGYSLINDILKRDGKTIRIGVTFERFEESLLDINAWLDAVKKQGYRRIIILGHSLGCNKIIRYLYKNNPAEVVGLVLASPPDTVGLFEKTEYHPNHKVFLEEARLNVIEGNPRKLVSGMVWDWFSLSSQTYLDLSEQGGPADNLPVRRSSDEFIELAKIKIPIMAIMGEKDDIAIKSLSEDMDLIQQKAVGCPAFTKKFISGANHTYDFQEEQFAKVVVEWVENLKE